MKHRLQYLLALLLVLAYSCDQSIPVSDSFELEEDATVLAERITYINEAIDIFDTASIPTARSASGQLSTIALTPQYDLGDGYTTIIEGTYFHNLQINEGDVVCIAETGDFSGAVKLNGGALVVMGTAKLSWLSGVSGTIINNPTGTIESNGLSLNKNITFANYGLIDMPSWASLTISGQFENYADFTSNAIYINNKGRLYNSGNIEVKQNISISSVFHNHGHLTVGNSLHVNTNGELLNNCNMTIGANMTHNGYLVNNAYIEIASRFYVNSNKGFEIQGGALIKAERVFVNDDITSSGNELAVIYAADKIFHSKGEIADNLILTTDESDCFVPSTDCSPGIGDEPRYTLLFEIEPPLLNGQLLSATCVQVVDDMAYVSYHMNGEDYGAAIDVLELNGTNEPTLVQTLFSSSFDFNELKMDDVLTNGKRRMWVMGAQQMNDNTSFESAAVALEVLLRDGFVFDFYHRILDLKGSSGNSIVKRGNELIAVSGSKGGLTLIDYDAFAKTDYVPLNYAKYLNCLGDDAVSLTASLAGAQLMHYSDDLHSPDVTAGIGSITPYDGKLVVHLDDDKTYISCATNGLKVYNTSTLEEVATYQESSSSTNCVTSDEDFVYLANGSEGLVILGKEKLNKVGDYAFDGSANFVSAFGNYIFLADGRGGFKVVYRVQ